jgi:hypothetical protein
MVFCFFLLQVFYFRLGLEKLTRFTCFPPSFFFFMLMFSLFFFFKFNSLFFSFFLIRLALDRLFDKLNKFGCDLTNDFNLSVFLLFLKIV